MVKVLVTGATGFVGTHLVAELLSTQYKVFAASSELGDIANDSTWAAFPDSEVVIHLAGKSFIPESWDNPNVFLHTNLCGTICALKYCLERKSRLIFTSTYLYGATKQLPTPESARLQASNPYALSKKMAEEACRFYSDRYGVKVTILRPFNLFGPGQSKKFLIPSIIDQVLRGDAVEIRDLEPKRDYIYIDDLVGAFIKAIKKPQRFAVFNIASGTNYSVRDVINMIQHLASTNLPVHSQELRRTQEVMETKGDISQARQVLEWAPGWSLSSGLKKIIQSVKCYE